MNLIILLSALLSALTGVAEGGRTVEARAVAERVVAAPTAARVVATTTRRPADVVAGISAVTWVRVVLLAEPAPGAPLYLTRRRE